MKTSKLIKVTCTRCHGSGRFSFNLIRGTVCFLCEGKGAIWVDSAKEEKRFAAAVKRKAIKAATATRRAELAAQVREELIAELGPFSDDAKGSYELVCACQRKYGKTPGDIVSERLKLPA